MARAASTQSRSSAKRYRVREQWAQRGFSPADLLNLWSRRPNLLMQLATPHQASSDVGRLQRRAFGR